MKKDDLMTSLDLTLAGKNIFIATTNSFSPIHNPNAVCFTECTDCMFGCM